MSDEIQPALGAALKTARRRLELTHEQVAEMVGYVPEVYGRIERGEMLPSLPKLRRLCVVLEISSDALLSLGRAEGDATAAAPPPQGDPPELRHIMSLLRAWSRVELRLLSRVLKVMSRPRSARKGSPNPPPTPES